MPVDDKTRKIYDLLFKEYIQMLRDTKMPKCEGVFSKYENNEVIACCASGLWLHEKKEKDQFRLPSYAFFIGVGAGIIFHYNDTGWTFSEIADYLEDHPEEFEPSPDLADTIRSFPSITASLQDA